MSDARNRLEALAEELGTRAGTSGLESGDYETYLEEFAEEEEPPDACLAEDYWDAEYEGQMEEAIEGLSSDEAATLTDLSGLRTRLRALYGAAFSVAVKG